MPGEMTFAGALGQTFGSSAASSAGSGLFGQLFAGMNARRQWKYQQKQMKLQQQYALEQMQKQGEIDYSNWQKQFDYENAYNDPSKIFERYSAAGASPAAVLGSSGVGVNATMSGGSGPSVGASGPSGGSGAIGASPAISGDPTAISQSLLNSSAARRNDAAARLDQAEAQRVENETPSRDSAQETIELNTQLLRANINSVNALSNYYSALQENQSAYNKYADLRATYDFQAVVAAYSEQVERSRRLRAENDAEIPLLEQSAAANLAYLRALTSAASASASESASHSALLDLQQKDMQQIFTATWETPVRVPLVDSKGKPTGEFEEITGREYYNALRATALTDARQGVASNWFAIRKNKNALFYDTTKAFATAAGIYAASKSGGSSSTLDAGTTTGGNSSTTRTTTYDSNGNVRGYVLHEMTGESHGASSRRRSR